MAKPHDIFFRHVFQTPERTASLLRVAAEKSPGLKEFIDAVNLDTLQEISGAFAESGETGAADLAFTVNLKGDNQKNAELLVNKPAHDILVQAHVSQNAEHSYGCSNHIQRKTTMEPCSKLYVS